VSSAAESRNPVRISFDKTEAHGQSNSIDEADKSLTTVTVALTTVTVGFQLLTYD